MLTSVLIGLAAIPIAALVVVLVRFNSVRLHIFKSASRASEAQLEAIYTLVEAGGSEPPNGYVLARTNEAASSVACRVPLPGLPDFPWSNQTVEIVADRKITFNIGGSVSGRPTLKGRVYRPVAVPRGRSRAGKLSNTFSPDKYFSRNEELQRRLRVICPRHPKELLAFLLCAGSESHEFEPIDQIRIGSAPAWVQEPESPSCDRCSRRLSLILQIPGTLLAHKASRNGTFYLFGCKSHPDQTKSVVQFS